MKYGVKFCGINQEGDIAKAAEAGAQAVGAIVRPDSTLHERSDGSRSISVKRACELARATPQSMDFVVAPRTSNYDEIVAISEEVGPDRLQIAEAEDPELLAALRDRFKHGLPVLLTQVIQVREGTSPEVIDKYLPHAQFFLLDSPGDQPGGNAATHNWNLSHGLTERAHTHNRPVILAGGLNIANVAKAVSIVGPDGVDAESANRINGEYVQGLMQRFVQNATAGVTA